MPIGASVILRQISDDCPDSASNCLLNFRLVDASHQPAAKRAKGVHKYQKVPDNPGAGVVLCQIAMAVKTQPSTSP